MSSTDRPICRDLTNTVAEPGQTMVDPGRRFPLITSPAYYDKMSYLSDEAKRMGQQSLSSRLPTEVPGVKQPPEHALVQLRNPCMIFLYDPELFEREFSDYDEMATLVIGMTTAQIMEMTDENGLQIEDPDIRRRYHAAMLMVTKIAQEYQDEWTLHLMSTVPSWSLSKSQYCLLGQPESVVWSEEERLILEFTAGIIHRKMPDALFEKAETTWGTLQLLRYSKWIAYYIGLTLMNYIDITDAEKRGDLPRPA